MFPPSVDPNCKARLSMVKHFAMLFLSESTHLCFSKKKKRKEKKKKQINGMGKNIPVFFLFLMHIFLSVITEK